MTEITFGIVPWMVTDTWISCDWFTLVKVVRPIRKVLVPKDPTRRYGTKPSTSRHRYRIPIRPP